ncbi:MAG: hypothetical protein DWP92_10970 [Armatimonadetes bacterium]|nr:MAG: hypothetical protein DWP92_10970 [Armatimonadota bacterium]
MKKFLITAAVAGVMLVGAIAFVSVTSDDVATAQPAPAADSFPDISDDTTIGSLVDSALDRLQDLGVLTPEAVDKIVGAIDEANLDLDDMTVSDVKELIAGFDWDSIDWNSLEDRFHDEIKELDLENFELPEGWEMPEGFDEKWFDQDWFKDFSFDTFEFPEDFNHDGFVFELPEDFNPEEFSFGGSFFKDIDPQELMEAFENGTIDELFDFDLDGLTDGFEWFDSWLDDATASFGNAAAA